METTSVTDFRGDLLVTVNGTKIRNIIQFLKHDSSIPFEMLVDLFAMDYLGSSPATPERFAVIYNLYSLSKGRRVYLKAFLPEAKPEIASLFDLYKAADWFEREAWDLFGIVFLNHPNLIRILCHSDFVGHPLRKDYPSDKYQRLKAAIASNGF